LIDCAAATESHPHGEPNFRDSMVVPSFEETIQQFVQQADLIGKKEPVIVVAHSWGCLIVLAAFSEGKFARLLKARIKGGLLINPVPLSRKAFDAVAKKFRGSLPLPTKLNILYNFAIKNDGNRVTELLLPYYGVTPTIDVIAKIGLDLQRYSKGMRSVGEFDLRPDIDLLGRFIVVLGENDITDRAQLSPLLAQCREVITVPQAGHFPMFDQPTEFSRIAARQLNKLTA
jgi:pimeloyl-ACP methyl ester carboxylesterase